MDLLPDGPLKLTDLVSPTFSFDKLNPQFNNANLKIDSKATQFNKENFSEPSFSICLSPKVMTSFRVTEYRRYAPGY